MKQLTCEMCGGTDLIKQDGVFVCQNCGMKYSAEEAKKMMVEGTVKVDNSEKLKNLYQVARQSRDSNDFENAAKYYDMIMQEDPNSWEAAFYNVYYRAMQTRIAFIASAATSVENSLSNVFALIKKNEDITSQKVAVSEITIRVTQLCSLLESNARNTLKSSWDGAWGKYSGSDETCLNYFLEYHTRSEAVYLTLFTLGDLIEKNYSDDPDMMKIAVTVWKYGVQYWINDYRAFDEAVQNKAIMDNSYGAKIKKYESDYTYPSPNCSGFPQMIANRCNMSSNSTSNTSSTNSGCYVATCVYGSYDCPQVWTLRRYRDYTLAKTWYGRAFIRTYYAISPTLVKWFGHTEWFKKMWQGTLDWMVEKLQFKGVESTPYEDRNW